MKKKLIIGIAGFLGSGKTTAGKIFMSLGADFIEADNVVKDLYQPGAEGWKKIVSFLGEKFLKKDGTINKNKLASFVFEDAHKLRIVNNLIHPMVTAAIRKKIADSNANVIVVEAVYFEEKQLGDVVDKIIWIECDNALAKERIIRINKFDDEMFDRIRHTQTKPKKIDFIINNDGDEAGMTEQIKQIMASFTVEK